MKCPACGKGLVVRTVGDVAVDVCKGGCGGIWFDQLELRKVDEKDEAAGEALLDVPRDPNARVDLGAARPCPKCPDVVMMRHFFSPRRQVELDECGGCGGIWLDAGELSTIRALYDSDDERKAHAHAYFAEVFARDLETEAADGEAERGRLRTVARVFRYLCPSWYLPGDQSWGAF